MMLPTEEVGKVVVECLSWVLPRKCHNNHNETDTRVANQELFVHKFNDRHLRPIERCVNWVVALSLYNSAIWFGYGVAQHTTGSYDWQCATELD